MKSTSHAGAPGTAFWVFGPAGFEQVGCVYTAQGICTAQGFEYDYGAVIGPDRVWPTDHREARPDHSHDQQVKRGAMLSFDRAVRNTYKGASYARDAGNADVFHRRED
ncbi:DNA/RNA helicase domain-containing protein [Gordonia jinghuaiqii]|uniref:DNA/RNA helicase domain-containing protein n=1 Tax=Gordonia jinghuaiqii TaxID=2758710 RepID=UPI001CB7A8A2|nr:DNA/RNA helicase domain-containing protein [Gordonia jinghuaiqii]